MRATGRSGAIPDPVLQSGGNAEGSYTLDPNGDSSYLSGVVSTTTLILSAGLRLSVDADTQGSATPEENNYKFYTKFQCSGGSQTIYPSAASGLAPPSVFDGWHSYAFDFKPNGSAQVSVDEVRTFESSAGFFDYGVDDSFALVFAGRSYSSTVNLYDSIQVVQSPEPSAIMLLFIGLGLFASRTRRR